MRTYASISKNGWGGKGYAVYNPDGKPLEELPVIYGFNNGGSRTGGPASSWQRMELVWGGHICSNEGYMPHDLGVTNGSRPDRHETFQSHYPDGYRMDFVSAVDEKAGRAGVNAAYKKNQEKAAIAKATDISGCGTPPNGQPHRAQRGSPSNGTGFVGRPGNALLIPDIFMQWRGAQAPYPA